MSKVKIKSYAKVNLTLEIVGNTGDYHALDSLVASVDIFDLIEIKSRRSLKNTVTMYGMNSEFIPLEQNHAKKAADAFCKKFQTTGVDITVYKNIPIGAGLGGSSADIVGVINGMAKLYGITDKKALKELADELGSDTGYMLTGGFARMQGRGEQVTPIQTDAKLYFLLICPQASISAGECYRVYDKLEQPPERIKKTDDCLQALLQKDINGIGRYLTNDLFLPASELCSDVKKAYEEALAFAPNGVVMTGSGSCVAALFDSKDLCAWARSRYKGVYDVYTVETCVPNGADE